MKLLDLNHLKVKGFAFLLVGLLAFSALATPLTRAQDAVLWEGWTKSRNLTAGETTYSDVTNASANDTVRVQLWHHNRENPTAGPLAQNVKVKFVVPSTEGKSHDITGISSADNAPTISDATTVNTDPENTTVEFIPGSSKFRYNKGAQDGNPACETGFNNPPASCYATVSLPDSVVTTGVNLDAVRGGPLRGCNAHHETVIIDVVVKKKTTPPPSTGVCKMVAIEVLGDRKVRATVTGEVNNAEIVGYEINWGDGTKSNKQTDEHVYANNGKYRIVTKVQVKFADGTTEWITSTDCTKDVTFKENEPPVVTPPPTVTPPTTLPVTGAGEILGLFTATSIAGAVAHRVYTARRRILSKLV